MITLPVILALAEITLFRRSMKQAAGRMVIIACITAPALLAYIFIAHGLHGQESVVPRGFLDRLYHQYAKSGLSLFEALLTESRVWWEYVRCVVWPFAQDVPLLRAEIVSRSLWSPPATIFACAGALAIVALGAAFVRRLPVISFGLLWFVVTLIPESVLIPQYLYFGYRAILPMAGLLIALGWGTVDRSRKAGDARIPAKAVHCNGFGIGDCRNLRIYDLVPIKTMEPGEFLEIRL